jgi:O-antigen ligase
MGGVAILKGNGSRRLKYGLAAAVLVLGTAVFAWRFHSYLAAGASSAGARLDYWSAAVQTARDHPWLGTGPGTFQRPYERLKSPSAEMARLVHNDYLEQFSDSGFPGGFGYAAWVLAALAFVGRRWWRSGDHLAVSIYLGLLGWFVQGLGEFSLYVPALAWTAFALLGCLVGAPNPIDIPKRAR